MANRRPRPDPRILTINDLKQVAEQRIPAIYRDYFNEGAGELITARDNEDAYYRYKLRPRVMRDVEDLDTSTTMFGIKAAFPLGIAPAAAHKLAHPDAERGVSRASARHSIPLCLSSWSTTLLEDVKQIGGQNAYVMQISLLKDPQVAIRIIKRAERAGYKAIFVTVDLPVLGNRLNEVRNNFAYPTHVTFPNLEPMPDEAVEQTMINPGDYDRTMVWEKTIPWLRSLTKMEIWLKGIYTAEDTQLAIDHRVDGIVISNHGGRQLDGVPATLDALRECAPVATGKIGIAMDGGIRKGSDIFKAIALGAQFVWVGRVPIWGLAYNGEEGVNLALQILLDEFRDTMVLAGCRTVSDIRKSHLSTLGPNGVLAKL